MSGVEEGRIHASLIARELGIDVIPATLNEHMSERAIKESIESGALHAVEPVFKQALIVVRKAVGYGENLDDLIPARAHNKREIEALIHTAAVAVAGCVKAPNLPNPEEFEELRDGISEDIVAAFGALGRTKVPGAPRVDYSRARDLIGDHPRVEKFYTNHRELFVDDMRAPISTPVTSFARSLQPLKVR